MTYITYAIVNDTCPVCGQGRIFVAEEQRIGTLFLICENCESEWNGPSASKDAALATRDQHPFLRYLMPGDLSTHPWHSSVLNK